MIRQAWWPAFGILFIAAFYPPSASAQSTTGCKLAFTTDGVSAQYVDPVSSSATPKVKPDSNESLHLRLDDGTCLEVKWMNIDLNAIAVNIPKTAKVGEAVTMMALLSPSLGSIDSDAVVWKTNAGKPVSGRIVEQIFPKEGNYHIQFWLNLPDGRLVFNTYDIQIMP